jgi:hypothetical protein
MLGVGSDLYYWTRDYTDYDREDHRRSGPIFLSTG